MKKNASRRSTRRFSIDDGEELRRRLVDEEIGAIRKPFNSATSVALVYPNTYQVGMSSLGFQTLVGRINRRSDASCERFFSSLGPGDQSPPRSIEDGRPIGEFPIIAFSISFEMDYFHVLEILHRSGIALRWRDRKEGAPLVIAGGRAMTMNRLPLYDFLDVIVHGDGEEAIDAVIDAVSEGGDREMILGRLSGRPGFELPPLVPEPADPSPAPICLASRLSEFPCHSVILTPNTEFPLRGLIELSRGCPYKCAFCIMGYQRQQYRRRSSDDVIEMARLFRPHTDRVGLVASAVGAHPEIEAICERLDGLGMNVSFSSLRVEDVKPRMIESLLHSGQQTLTIAPEAGNDLLRAHLHKRLPNDQIAEFAASAFEQGMFHLKLYYMIGIPGETDDDIQSIAGLTRRLHEIQMSVWRPRGRLGRLNVNVGILVPKPGTPLGREPFCGIPEARRKIRMLEREFSALSNIDAHFESPREAAVQALLASGGRECGDLLENAVIHHRPIQFPV